MTEFDEQGRPDPPLAGDEAATLVGFLDWQRATLAWKTADLDARALNATVPPSDMTLGGMLKHLAYVEDTWIGHRVAGHERSMPWNAVDWAADPDWDWHSAADDRPETIRQLWHDAVTRSRSLLDEALRDGGLDALARRPRGDGRTPSRRWIVCHLIEEYARHLGHADLIRQAIDGAVGE